MIVQKKRLKNLFPKKNCSFFAWGAFSFFSSPTSTGGEKKKEGHVTPLSYSTIGKGKEKKKDPPPLPVLEREEKGGGGNHVTLLLHTSLFHPILQARKRNEGEKKKKKEKKGGTSTSVLLSIRPMLRLRDHRES